MNIQQLKEKYDGKSIDEIEQAAKNSSVAQEDQHRQFIGALFYLENTKRFRENKAYKSASFADYLIGFYGTSIQTYNRYRFAYFRYSEASENLGPGTVMKIVSRCGAESVQKVVNAIEKEKKRSPKLVSEIIDKFAKPRLKKRQSRPSYIELERELAAKTQKLIEAEKIISEQAEQIEKLKATVRRYESGISKLMPPIAASAGKIASACA